MVSSRGEGIRTLRTCARVEHWTYTYITFCPSRVLLPVLSICGRCIQQYAGQRSTEESNLFVQSTINPTAYPGLQIKQERQFSEFGHPSSNTGGKQEVLSI